MYAKKRSLTSAKRVDYPDESTYLDWTLTSGPHIHCHMSEARTSCQAALMFADSNMPMSQPKSNDLKKGPPSYEILSSPFVIQSCLWICSTAAPGTR